MGAPPGNTAGRELRALLAPVEPALRRGAARLWQPAGLTDRYRRYLTTMHMVIRASVPLMELAARRCRATRDDPELRSLAGFLDAHIERERHHDMWLLRDIAAAGLDPARELARPPSPQVARLAGAQYYWISHHHPASLLGYIAVLELHAPAPELADLLARRTGLPPAAFDTVRLHADADAGHSAEVLAALDRAPLTASSRRIVRLSALHTVAALIEVLDSVTSGPGGQPAAPHHPPERRTAPRFPEPEGAARP